MNYPTDPLDYWDKDQVVQKGDAVEAPPHYKKCFRCQQSLPLKNFAKNKAKKDGLQERCRKCCKTHRFSSGYNLRQKDLVLRQKYNISLEDLKEMEKQQKECCYICQGEDKLYVDHDHKTGQVRKLLCHYCNTGLGLFKEDISILEKVIEYIKEHNND